MNNSNLNRTTIALTLAVMFIPLVISCGAPKKPAASPEAQADCSECDKALADSRAAQSALEAKLETADSLATRRRALYNDLRKNLAELIRTGKVTITFRRGLMIIGLSNEILFESGKAKLTTNGSSTLGELTSLLREISDRRFLVAGHTDNVPVAKKATEFKSNWQLSSLRAQAVLDVMLSAGMPPGAIGFAGFGEHDPAVSNDSEEGRQRNRRIEIILIPNLEGVLGTPTE